MSWLAVWLIAVGLADLLRSGQDRRIRRASIVVGPVVLLALGVAAGLTRPADLVVLVAAIPALQGWIHWSGQMITRGRGHAGALTCLLGAVAVMLALSGAASPVGGLLAQWWDWMDLPVAHRVSPERGLLSIGLILANLATGNLVVRCVLVSVGALRPTADPGEEPCDRLRGGRLLGPMERVFILGLGLAGEITAASIVIAAKGLLRFPELQANQSAATSRSGIDEVTEYFLVGSFVSWLLALTSLVLCG